jgi:hypothetical protein
MHSVNCPMDKIEGNPMYQKDYTADMRRDVERLQNILRFARGEKLDEQLKKSVVADLTASVERDLHRLQHALAALSDRDYEGSPAGQVKDEGAKVRADAIWGMRHLTKAAAQEKDSQKKHALQAFLKDAKARAEAIAQIKNRGNQQKKVEQWKQLRDEINAKRQALESSGVSSIVEEKPGRRFRED